MVEDASCLSEVAVFVGGMFLLGYLFMLAYDRVWRSAE